jgi:imidazolonepropionase-like amidohydrolase
MRRSVLFIVVLVCCGISARASDIRLVHARIYTGPGVPPIEDGTVVVHNGVITAVGPSSSVKGPHFVQAVTVYDCTGMTITAGFWNSHVHILTDALLDAEHKTPVSLTSEMQKMFTHWGFTTVFDVASVLSNTNYIRRHIADGSIVGPRILTVGEPFYGKGGTPVYVAPFLAEHHVPSAEVDTIPEAVARVHQQVRDGADGIKIFAGSIESNGVLLMHPDLAKAIVDAAHGERKLVFSHPSTTEGVELSLDSGVDILAHVALMGGPWPPSLVQRMKAAHISLVPTLTMFDVEAKKAKVSEQEDQEWMDLAVHQLQVFREAGGEILFGTDVGYTDHYDTAEEYALMQKAGMNFADILASLTTTPARRFGYTHSGYIASGMDADLVVLKSDPAVDITALSRVIYTVRAGDLIYAAK